MIFVITERLMENLDKKLKSFVVATLRRASYRWIPRSEALSAARVRRGVYTCNHCKLEHPKKNIEIDHIMPIVPVEGWDTWDGFIGRLFCDVIGYQILCCGCHSLKSVKENEQRRLHAPVDETGKKGRKRNA